MSQLSQINSVKSLAAFYRSVNKAHAAHMADIERAKADQHFDVMVLRAERAHWAACQRPAAIDTRHDAKQGLFKRALEVIHQTAMFANGRGVTVRNGRTGTIIRRLTDGRYVVKVDCGQLYWELYDEAALDALQPAAKAVAA